jgi:hypothetical protein
MTAKIARASTRCSLALLTVGVALSIAVAQPASELLTKRLAEFKGADRGKVIPVAEDPIARAFPGHWFYVLRFSQYPVALVPPAPLTSNNLFVVKADGLVAHITDPETLKTFFSATLPPVRTEAEARDVAKAWLRLAQEFLQDGFLQFAIPDDSLRIVSTADGGLLATGRAVVTPHGGNQGEIVAALTFDQSGQLVSASETAKIKRGIRPICQATKLLDPDPIVRGMAEQAILVMGKDAKEYLDQVRATASAQLRQAIDLIWSRILVEDR